MSSWLGGSKQIAVGRVVRYWTHERHEQDGFVFHRGSFCFATRTPSGELGLFFFQEGFDHGDIGRALWLPGEYGLCGVEPGILNPQLRNMAMVNEAVRQSDARVLGEIQREAESRKPKAESSGAVEMHGEFRGDGVEGKWEVLEAHVAPSKVVPAKAAPAKEAPAKKVRKAAKKARSKK